MRINLLSAVKESDSSEEEKALHSRNPAFGLSKRAKRP